MKKAFSYLLTIFVCLNFATAISKAQSDTILSLNIDGKAFFVNNEFESPLVRGYTLPGFRLSPTISYSPNKKIKLQAGAFMMHYWGADRYPETHYQWIPDFSADNFTRGFHILPILRAEMAPAKGLRVVLGSIYGSLDHHLITPLYANELQYSADPEAGMQILYDSDHFDADIWVDWRTFIYNLSPYRENFMFGATTKIKFTKPEAHTLIYMPLQVLAEHFGGEIDIVTEHTVMTFINGAAGIGAKIISSNSGKLKWIQFEADALYSAQQSGHTWPNKSGWGIWANASARLGNFTIQTGYLYADKFVTLQGLPLFGTLTANKTTVTPGIPTSDRSVLEKPSTIVLGADYNLRIGKEYSLRVFADMYYQLATDESPCTPTGSAQIQPTRQSATSFSFGAALTFSPSFKLK